MFTYYVGTIVMSRHCLCWGHYEVTVFYHYLVLGYIPLSFVGTMHMIIFTDVPLCIIIIIAFAIVS